MENVNPIHAHSFNQTYRFGGNASALVSYVCSTVKQNPLVEWAKSGKISEERSVNPDYHDNYNFEPFCPFPFINKGWAADGKESSEDIVMNDCSLTWAETTDGAYQKKCAIYSIVACLPLFWCLSHLRIFYLNKVRTIKNKKRHPSMFGIFSRHPNINEQMCWLGVWISVIHTVMCTDIDAWSTGNLMLKQLLMAWLTASIVHILVLLVSSWITIIDAGTTRITPPWCQKLVYFSYFGIYVFETVCGQLMRVVGKAKDYDCYSSAEVTFAKSIMFVLLVTVWGCLAYVYGLRIKNQLENVNDNSQLTNEQKKISKWLRTTCRLCFLGFWWKTLPLISFSGRAWTFYGIPPCKVSMFAFVNVGIFVTQYSIAYAQQPLHEGKTATMRLAEGFSSTFLGTKSKTGKNSNKKGWNSTGSVVPNSGDSSGTESSDVSSVASESSLSMGDSIYTEIEREELEGKENK